MRALYYTRALLLDTTYYQSTDTPVSSALALLDSTFVCGTKYKNRAKSAFSVAVADLAATSVRSAQLI